MNGLSFFSLYFLFLFFLVVPCVACVFVSSPGEAGALELFTRHGKGREMSAGGWVKLGVDERHQLAGEVGQLFRRKFRANGSRAGGGQPTRMGWMNYIRKTLYIYIYGAPR